MTREAVKITILDKEYIVACPPGEEEALQASAKHLSEKMREIRAGGKVVGIDRIAVMAGLNIAHDAIELGIDGTDVSRSVGARLNKLNSRIEETLTKFRQPELN
ncbi:MAG: cell division protein ZapA [Gammaproteobacteria bacterium]|jgi:cell division protein ZapA